MGFGDAVSSGLRNYANFRGRATRSEYWFWVLFTIVGSIITSIGDVILFGVDGIDLFNTVFNLTLLIPSFAVGVRRLHDIDRTGWWLLISLTVIGIVVLIVWFCQKSDPVPNRFGAPPIQPALA